MAWMEEQEDNPNLPPKPELYQDLIPVWECFWFLSPSRPQGMDLGAITLTEIVTYWKEIGGVIDQDDLNEKTRLVRIMDNTFLEIAKEKNSAV